jgi:hypothetical protein
MKVFAHIESDVPKMEKDFSGKFAKVLPAGGNTWLQGVAIRPVLEEPAKTVGPRVAPVDVEHLWKPGMLRLFLSHVSAHKVAVSKLKLEFRKFAISSVVAHEDIEPTLEWQREIELALRSMHALVVLLTFDFHESKWTDQEAGFALGKGVPGDPRQAWTGPIRPDWKITRRAGQPRCARGNWHLPSWTCC